EGTEENSATRMIDARADADMGRKRSSHRPGSEMRLLAAGPGGSRQSLSSHPQSPPPATCALAVSRLGGVFVVFLEQLFLGHLLVGDLGELDQEIDHLLFVDRRADAGHCLRVLAVIVPDLLLAAGNLARALDDRTLDLLVRDLD